MKKRLNLQQIEQLITAAEMARGNAYAPYSNYLVGAALLCDDGNIITGCNVENASFGATNCAERNALFAAIGEGYRAFRAIGIVAGPENESYVRGGSYQGDLKDLDYPSPCGICRQALREFVSPKEFQVILAKTVNDYRILTLEQLLPESFGPEFL